MKRFENYLAKKHKGQKCLLCGAGSSLDLYPKSFYENWDGFTLGINRIKLLFQPDYWMALDLMHGVVEDCKEQEWYQCKRVQRDVPELGKRDGIIDPGTNRLTICTALSVAYQLGASEIYLIGVDFCLGANGSEYHKERVAVKNTNRTAFDLEQFLGRKTKCLVNQIDAYEANGTKIYDLSPFGILEGTTKTSLIKGKENE